jgi:hypothetical protein
VNGCLDGEVSVVAAPPRQPSARTLLLSVREQAGLLSAVLLDHAC